MGRMIYGILRLMLWLRHLDPPHVSPGVALGADVPPIDDADVSDSQIMRASDTPSHSVSKDSA